jgi:hypothetical protein
MPKATILGRQKLDACRNDGRPAKAILDKHHDDGEAYLASEACLAGIAGQSERRVLDHAVTQVKREAERP